MGVTTESARFLGRKVCFGIVVVLMSALASGVVQSRFASSTIERWYDDARNERWDPAGALRKTPRKDLGQHPAMAATPRPDHRARQRPAGPDPLESRAICSWKASIQTEGGLRE